jgi:hypothetical protein
MIVPTIGRIVWMFRTSAGDWTQAEPAIVCYVHGDNRYINVAGFDHQGEPFSLTSVYLVQEGEAKPEGQSFACWMPYQQAAAKKYPA